MQILEYEQHGRGSGAPGEQRQRLLEHPQLRARPLPAGPPGLPEPAQPLGERLIRQLRADQVDRAAEKNLEPGAAGTSRGLGGEPGLADARLSRDQDGRALPGPRCAEARSSSASSAARPTNTSLARASILVSIAQQTAGWKGADKHPSQRKYVRPRPGIRLCARCAPAPRRPPSNRYREHEEARDGCDRTRRAEADRADEGSHGAGRRRPAAARAGAGQGGWAADPVHSRLVAEPPVLGQAVPERARRRVPARRLRSARPRDVRGPA